MKLILLNRLKDESGISGTGIVAEGIEFDNGKCVISWLTEHTSITVYDNIEEVKAIHGHGDKTDIITFDLDFVRTIAEKTLRGCPHGHKNWDECPVCGH